MTQQKLFCMDQCATSEAALEYLKSRRAYEDQFGVFFADLESLPEPLFWSLLDQYVALTHKQRKYKMSSGYAVDEFFRQPHDYRSPEFFGGRDLGYTFHEAMRFARTYHEKTNLIGDKLWDVHGGSDDGYSDFVDCLPLVGEETFNKCLAGYYGNLPALKEGVLESFQLRLLPGDRDDALLLTDMVLHDEMYHCMHLYEEAQHRYPYAVEMAKEAAE